MRKVVIGLSLVLIAFISIVLIGACSLQEKLIFIPSTLPADFKYQFEGNWKEVNFQPEPDIQLNAIHFKADTSKGLVLYFHGNAGCLEGWGHVGNYFTPLGYDVLVMDFRGYGKSTGKIKSEKQLQADAEFIYQQMLKEYPEEKIVVVGRSIGTGIASQLAANHDPAKLFLVTPYYDLPKLVKHIYPIVPRFLIRYKFRNDEYVQQVKCPVHIFHGTHDEIIPFQQAMDLKALGDHIQLHTITGAGHNDIPQHDAYHQALAEALNN